MCEGNFKKKELLLTPASKMEESCAVLVMRLEPFKWAKSADASYLPYGNGFVCGINSPSCLAGILGA